MQTIRVDRASRKGTLAFRCPRLLALILGLGAMGFTSTLQATVTVDTLGGGPRDGHPAPAGYTDGSTFSVSQFNNPFSSALDSQTNLFIADKANNAVRQVTKIGNSASSQTLTYIGSLSQPIGVAVDRNDALYVLTQGDSKIRKYNKFKNAIYTNTLPSTPTAFTVADDANTNIFVTLLNGNVIRVTQTGVITTNATGFNGPKGIAILPNGMLAVSDTLNHAIRLINTNSGAVTLLTGGNGAGWVDGDTNFVQLNQPHGLAASADGRLAVADRLNHRVRLVETNGTVSTIYGVPSEEWFQPYPGWEDGEAPFVAAGRDPVSISISSGGLLFVTELFYHTLRSVSGTGLSTAPLTNSAALTNPPPPTFSQMCGYYPQCQTITVTNGAGTVFYTSDGTEPTTNSLAVATTNGVGVFQWCNSLRDLTSLRLKNFNGTNSSVTVSGQSCSANQIGFARDVVSGIGSTAVIPIVMNLQSNQTLRSLQFRVEVTPTGGNPNMISSGFAVLPSSSNDFVNFVGASEGNVPASFGITPYTSGNTRGMVISAIGAGTGFFVQNFAVAALLAVPIPAAASAGQTYRLDISYTSGTSDGVQATVPLTNMVSRTILVENLPYLVGDSSFGNWYGAGEFGNGKLDNSDVNNAKYASLGIRVPYKFTDVYNTMDAWPPDNAGQTGNAVIDFRDWQTILDRSLGQDVNNWLRFWSVGGTRSHQPITIATSFAPAAAPKTKSPGKSLPPPGLVWLRNAVIGAGTLGNLLPSGNYALPVYVNVLPGYNLSGLQFRATLLPVGNAPTPGQIQFATAPGLVTAQTLAGLAPNDIACTWSLKSFLPSLQNSNLLGYINFQVPPSAQAGHGYTLHLSYVDGGPDLNTEYQLESLSGSAWVLSQPPQPSEIVSDEWKTHFFGSVTNLLATNTGDADGDGVPNWQEYLAGTDPTNAISRLQFTALQWSPNGGAPTLALSWLTAPGKSYVLESNPTLTGGNWTAVATNTLGDGYLRAFTRTNLISNAQFYRIRLQP
jgi:hypothetical protein